MSAAERIEMPTELGDDPSIEVEYDPSSLHEEGVELEVGDLVADRYVIESLIGSGGHGAIYRARHVELGLAVAIKVLHTHGVHAVHRELVQRFIREAHIAAQVHHRNVLSVHDSGTLSDGSPFLVMELIEGQDLERRIEKGPLSIAAIVDLGRQLFAGLTAIAEAGVLHRDVKPANVMLHREIDGQVLVKLVDFGIARSKAELEKLTLTGTVVGTPHYMSAEQLRGDRLDARADAYSAAAVLYEALTGQPPFDADSTALVIGQILTAPLTPIRSRRPDCPPALADLIERGLARERADRPAHPMRVVDALDAILHAEGLPTGALAWADDPHSSLTPPIVVARRRPHETPVPKPPETDEPHEEPPATPPPRPDEIQDPPPDVPRRRAWERPGIGVVTLGCAAVLVGLVASTTDAAPIETAAATVAAAPPRATDELVHDEVEESLQRGIESLARDEADAALANYRVAVRLDPERAEAHRGRGVAAARAGLDEEAIAAFERYLALAPDAGDADRVRDSLARLRARRSDRLANAPPSRH